MKHRDGWTESSDGQRLFWQRWRPDSGVRAALLFIHGKSEHSGRYTHVMRHFAERDFDCWAIDCRGHGHSPGLRIHVNDFDEYLLDIEAAYRLLRREQTWEPLFLIGHSQGGLLTLRYTLLRPASLDGIIVSSPALRLHSEVAPPVPLHLIANILSALFPAMMFSPDPEPERLSRDPRIAEGFVNDPLVSSTVSARWFTGFVKTQADTRDRAHDLEIPALIMQSGADTLVDPDATRDWAASAPAALVEYVEWDGFYHEMFNELEKERVFARMEDWLERQLETTPRAPST